MPGGKRNKKKYRNRRATASGEQHQGDQSQGDSEHPESRSGQRNISAPSVSRGIVVTTSLVNRSTASDVLLPGHSKVSGSKEVQSKNDSFCAQDNQGQSNKQISDKVATIDVPQETCTEADDKSLLNAIELASQDQALELLKGDHTFSQAVLNTALMLACLRGHKYLVQTLISLGANVQHKDINGNTPLLICADKGFIDIVRFLLTRKADVGAANYAGDTALILSIHSSGSTEMVKVLLTQKGINVNHQNRDGYTALMKAVEVKDIVTIKLLLEESYSQNYEQRPHIPDYERDWHQIPLNNKGQTAGDIAEKSGLGNVFRYLNQHRYTRTSPLVLAVEESDIESFNILLDCLFMDTRDMESSVEEAFRKLFTNCQQKEVKTFNDTEIMMIDRLIKCGADVNTYLYNCCPLSVAVEAGNYRLVELLCKHGAQLKKHWYGSESGPLQMAAKIGRCDLIELLLSYKADVNQNNFFGSALDCAFIHCHLDCAKLLIQRGATLDIKHALLSAVKHQVPEYISFLFDNYKQEALNHFLEKTENQPNLLISAVEGGNLEIIGQIIDAGADINRPTDTGETPLVESKNAEVARFLIQRGADVNQMINGTRYGRITPVIHVLTTRYKYDSPLVELLKVLLDNGASVNGRDNTSKTALMLAAEKEGSVGMLQMLLAFAAGLSDMDRDSNTDFLNAQDREGKTALMHAAILENLSVVTELIEHGADVNIKDVKGNTALLHALMKFRRRSEILTALIRAGSDINCQNNDGLTPLMLAASNNRTELIKILLDSGADVNAVSKNDHTRTALSCLLDKSYFTEDSKCCLEYLLEKGASASYISPEALINIFLNSCSECIPKMIRRGLGPADIKSDKIPRGVVKSGLLFNVSPLCLALLVKNVGLARYFLGNLFLTNSDVSSLTCNKDLRRILERKKYQECLTFLDEMSSQPLSLFKLSLVAVSSALGTYPGRENRVNLLPLPQMIKDKLLFKTEEVSLTSSTSDRTVTFIPSILNQHFIHDMSLEDYFQDVSYVDSEDDSSTEHGWYSGDYDYYDTN